MRARLDSLTLAELTQLIAMAEHRLKQLKSRRPIAVVRRELVALAASHGYQVQDLLETPPASTATRPRARKKSAKIAPKYRDPDNARNTWNGRGSQPRWLAEKVKRGQRSADFLIPGLARPTAKKASPVGHRTVYKAGAGSAG